MEAEKRHVLLLLLMKYAAKNKATFILHQENGSVHAFFSLLGIPNVGKRLLLRDKYYMMNLIAEDTDAAGGVEIRTKEDDHVQEKNRKQDRGSACLRDASVSVSSGRRAADQGG